MAFVVVYSASSYHTYVPVIDAAGYAETFVTTYQTIRCHHTIHGQPALTLPLCYSFPTYHPVARIKAQ